MKKLTKKELEEAPDIIQYIHTAIIGGHLIGASTYEQAMIDHPEYFPDEIERRKKWEAIPQEVHDAYWKEYQKIHKEKKYSGKGIMYWAEHPEEWDEMFDEFKEIKPLLKALHEKHYKKYGIEWIDH